ncbi:MAG: hypothetical protein CMG57_04840 [Candidatus Marinimicrobia bacterium]|nr:hypothetical protein [Candidatus Neomarinimicrobiota bacterium]
MSLNIMINKMMKLRIMITLLGTGLMAQESLYWEVADPIVNSEFIEAYINRLIEVDKFEENTIQASHSIIVHVEAMDDKVELRKLKAKNYQMGEYQSFMMDEVGKMDPFQLNTILDREYKWKDASREDLSELEEFSTVDNIFKERSFKDARDAFWWSNSQISASSSLKIFIRQKSSNLALRIEQGFADLGFSRQLSENLLLGLSNDMVSTYLIIPGNTESVLNGIGHPLEGNIGFGFKFDTHMLGGQVNYMDIDGEEYEWEKVYSRKHMVFPASSGLMYWSNTFQINRKVDTSYGKKLKKQKKEKAEAKKIVAKSRTWSIGDESYSGIFRSLKDGNVAIAVDRNEKDHNAAAKGRIWTKKSGGTVEAILQERDKNQVVLLRKSDEFQMVFKLTDLSEKDQEFLDGLKWDGEELLMVPLETLISADQQLLKVATTDIVARKGKGKELKISEAFASMRLKAGLSFAQIVHSVIDEKNDISITDRITGTNSIGFYAKVEGVTDTKNTKAFVQLNVSGNGFKAYSFGLEHNVYKMVNLGLDCTLYPNNSFIEFTDKRDSESKWQWYPGSRPDELGDGGGTLLISPYIAVNF